MVQPQRRIYRNDVSAELGRAGQGRYKRRDPASAPGLFCGERGIRTPGTETRTTV